ncbi:hypothetical protein [Chitinophaga rhizophila]|uniref:Uncharacterized protein n=1 Tax=Chitinophaga rhizophila TaxID=2866212 RepID=A0ABS7G9J3_9BACT|nr:hypothetical protein [Chitinophaga rhizophila]MBW8683188.1 hypothetical protein [Chitinophaga rhizophila]
MIEANDVRTGNLVWYYDLYMNETVFEVEGLLDGFIYNSSLPKSKLPLANVHPLTLDTHHLRSLAFVRGEKEHGEDEQVYSYRYNRKDNIYIRDEGYSFQPLAAAGGQMIPYGQPLVYVHQLQNLVYSLTGKEI